jgi:hypothetical protein
VVLCAGNRNRTYLLASSDIRGISLSLRKITNITNNLFSVLIFFTIMTTSNNLGPKQGPILIGNNYEFLSLRMRSFLQAHDCWDLVDLGYVELDPTYLVSMKNQERTAQAEQGERENKAKFWIQNSLDDSIF